MTREEMETLLKRYGFDSKDPLKQWLEAGMRDVEMEHDWPWLYTKETWNIKAGEEIYSPQGGVIKIVTIKDETNIYKYRYYEWHRFERDIREPKEKGKTELYTIVKMGYSNMQIKFWRIPESPIEITAMVQEETEPLREPSTVPQTAGAFWPLQAQFPIVLRAAVIALNAENEEERAKALQAEYDNLMTKLKWKYAEMELDEPATVADTMGYGDTQPYSWWPQ